MHWLEGIGRVKTCDRMAEVRLVGGQVRCALFPNVKRRTRRSVPDRDRWRKSRGTMNSRWRDSLRMIVRAGRRHHRIPDVFCKPKYRIGAQLGSQPRSLMSSASGSFVRGAQFGFFSPPRSEHPHIPGFKNSQR